MDAATPIKLIQMVQTVEARKLIPSDTPSAITYFSSRDEWHYQAVLTDPCADCANYEGIMTGDMLRALFPYLEIMDLDLILPNTHPNCRCKLVRVLYMGDIGTEQ